MENKKIELPYSIKVSKSAYIQFAIVFVTIPFLLTIIGFFTNKEGWSNLFSFLLVIWPMFLGLFALISGLMVVSSPKIILYSEYITYKKSFFNKTNKVLFNEIEKVDKTMTMRYGYRAAVPIAILLIKLKNGEDIQIPIGNFSDKDVRFLIQTISDASSGTVLNEWAKETKEGKPRDYYHFVKTLKENWLWIFIFIIIMAIVRVLITLWSK